MINIIKFELKKIFWSKKTYISLAIIFTWIFFTSKSVKKFDISHSVSGFGYPQWALSSISEIIIPVLLLLTCIDIFGSEFKDKTIRLIIPRNPSRNIIFFSKMFSMLLYIFGIVMFTYFISYIIGFSRFGFGNSLLSFLGDRHLFSPIKATIRILLIYFTYIITCLPFISFISCISIVVKKESLSFLFGILTLFATSILATKYPQIGWFMLAQLFDSSTYFIPTEMNTIKILYTLLACFIYVTIFVLVGLRVFKNKEL